MIEVFVSRLGLDSASNSFVVVLQEKEGTRLLPIWIGRPEADSILKHIHHVKSPRPIAHDLVRSLIVGMGAQLIGVHITRVEDRTYYAELLLQHGGSIVTIDARPSDSIAIALRLDAPIKAAENLLIEPSDETTTDAEDTADVELTGQPDFGIGGAVSESEEDDLTTEQLKRYLETLRPEDFGKFNP